MGYKAEGLFSRSRFNGGAHLLTPQSNPPPAIDTRRRAEPGIEGTGAKVTVDRAAAIRNGLKPRRVINV